MTDPIEAVARAIAQTALVEGYDEVPLAEIFPEPRPRYVFLHQMYMAAARAAIAAFLDAVREPADTIISKGADEYWIARLQPKFPGDEHMARGAWRSMIDALRAELLPPPGDGG